MSAETLTRIMEQTGARLAVASYGEETLAIGLEHMTKIGADLAETLFTHVSAEPFSNSEINALVLKCYDEQQKAIVETFASFGITEGSYLDECLEAASNGYLDRGEELFSAPQIGGRA